LNETYPSKIRRRRRNGREVWEKKNESRTKRKEKRKRRAEETYIYGQILTLIH